MVASISWPFPALLGSSRLFPALPGSSWLLSTRFFLTTTDVQVVESCLYESSEFHPGWGLDSGDGSAADTRLRSSASQAIRGCGGGGFSPVDEKEFGEITD